MPTPSIRLSNGLVYRDGNIHQLSGPGDSASSSNIIRKATAAQRQKYGSAGRGAGGGTSFINASDFKGPQQPPVAKPKPKPPVAKPKPKPPVAKKPTTGFVEPQQEWQKKLAEDSMRTTYIDPDTGQISHVPPVATAPGQAPQAQPTQQPQPDYGRRISDDERDYIAQQEQRYG